MGDLTQRICTDCGREHPLLEDCVHYTHLPLVSDWSRPLPVNPEWDEKVRGPKMSDVAGRTIFKYQMPVLEKFSMELPSGAEIIRVADQGGMFWLWAVVDTNAPMETRCFRAFKTGAPIPTGLDLRYVGFCAIYVQMELGLYIFEEVYD